ncbi:hypothetical protein D5R81_16095 [Parashewanella spongiae]|uniref:Uncharacterized protein n=1 Tax=Parashewanella spongiae TaxID=342950 RepID=A0A3A6THN6_9GAMM|nr:hypothetical protein [Parashewanella spongiae]MCL1079609.1 hypothetical protein [Parashewanella spongiae]RJY07351.1 hypothetical protein D5R81_16095 [Parashewanella spongiae]
MSVEQIKYSVFYPDEITNVDGKINTVEAGKLSKAYVRCYEREEGTNKVLGNFEYQVTNENGKHRLTEIYSEKKRPFRVQLAAFHFAKNWHEKNNQNYQFSFDDYKIISEPALSIEGVKTSKSYAISEQQTSSSNKELSTEIDSVSLHTSFDALSLSSHFSPEQPHVGSFINWWQNKITASTDHTRHHVTQLSEADDMIASQLSKHQFQTNSAVLVDKSCTQSLAEVKRGMPTLVQALRKKHPNKTILFPLGVNERGCLTNAHTVLGIVTPETMLIIDSDRFNFYGVIKSVSTRFQGLFDTTNCSRYAAYTCIELAKKLDVQADNITESAIKQALSSDVSPPSLDVLDNLYHPVTTEEDDTVYDESVFSGNYEKWLSVDVSE